MTDQAEESEADARESAETQEGSVFSGFGKGGPW